MERMEENTGANAPQEEMMRNGKIATLPSEIRNELSFRMHQGEPTKTLLAWLNALPLHEKPGASRNHDGAACQSPRPAQRGEGQREGSKTRPNKRCRSISSRPRSNPVKASQSETAGLAAQTPSAKTPRPQTPPSRKRPLHAQPVKPTQPSRQSAWKMKPQRTQRTQRMKILPSLCSLCFQRLNPQSAIRYRVKPRRTQSK